MIPVLHSVLQDDDFDMIDIDNNNEHFYQSYSSDADYYRKVKSYAKDRNLDIQSLFYNDDLNLPRLKNYKLKGNEVWVFVNKQNRIMYLYPYTGLLRAIDFAAPRQVFGLKLLRVTLNTLELLKTEYLENKLIILKKGQACVKGPLEGEIHCFDLIDL